jgi:ferric-dicitrate binding protein FerR (iron transport regulator)
MENDSLDDLLTRWADDELSAAEFAALEEALQADAGARKRLREHAALSDALREMPEPVATASGGFFSLNLPGWMPIGGASATLLLVLGIFVAVGLSAYWLGARIAGSKFSASQLPAIRTLHFGSGSAQLSLDRIGTVLVDGPAEFSLIGPMRARLDRGRIRVCVTEESGHGFVVETPDGEVTDLGTEFGLDVADGKQSGVVVFQGSVDLRIAKNPTLKEDFVERLMYGEGVTFSRQGQTTRIPCILTGEGTTFRFNSKERPTDVLPLIAGVSDNLSSAQTKRFYEIVPSGLREDALSHVDRPGHEWNGATPKGMPKHLLGADYVKTFCDDKFRKDLKIRVRLSRPAKLYVFFDSELEPPKWLLADFHLTKELMGRDSGAWPKMERPVANAVGPGNSIDHLFTIWERNVKKPCVVTLGANSRDTRKKPMPYMYGIAAVALDSREAAARDKK